MFPCKQCHLAYKHQPSLSRHIKRVHAATTIIDEGKSADPNFSSTTSSKDVPKGGSFLCSFCEDSFSSRRSIVAHYEESHDIQIIKQELTMESPEEFLLWKSKFEQETKANFVLQRGNGKILPESKTYYQCHRSGVYKGESSNIRHLKIKGSCKIDAFCPAEITVFTSKEGKCTVILSETHIGHSVELKHLRLSQEQRLMLASKISQKIPFDDILDEIRDGVEDEGLNRLHFAKRKDLQNIEASFKLASKAVRHANDYISVNSWVESSHEDKTRPLLFYKQQGVVLPDFPELARDDFMLAIMNEAQVSLMKKFGDDVVCTDGTHELNAYNFELTTVLVLDELRQGFPCAFLFSNRTDKAVLQIFFKHIKERLEEHTLHPAIFMSDMADSFYNAWIEVFGKPGQRLFCAWHVIHAWTKNLNKIKEKSDRDTTYKLLRCLLEEMDTDTFKSLLPNVVEHLLSTPETTEFRKYFKEHYSKNPEQWAYCHRVHSGLNTNMHVENMHRCLKYIYCKGKRVKRLDKALFVLMRFIRDKTFERVIMLHEGKVSNKLEELRRKHKKSLMMDINKVLPDGDDWIVASEKGTEMYNVTRARQCEQCLLRCEQCLSCIHEYICSCYDSQIKFNMCKHINLVCQMIKTSKSNLDATPGNVLPHSTASNEIGHLVQQLSASSNEANTLDSIRQTVIKTLDIIKSDALTSTSVEVLKTYQNLLDPIAPTIRAVKMGSTLEQFKEIDLSNKRKIDDQRKFISTKKVKQSGRKHLLKPNTNERDTIVFNLVKSQKETEKAVAVNINLDHNYF